MPDPAKTYRCKSCGGAVRVAPPAAEETACVSCGEPLAAGSSFCESCGVEQAPASAPAGRPAAAGRGGARSARQPGRSSRRRQVSGEIGKAMKIVPVLRFFFGLNALAALVLTGSLILALSSARVDPGFALLMAGFNALTAALMLAGFVMVRFQPFAWAVVLATFVTLGQVLRLANGEMPLIGWGWAALFWAAVAPTVSVRKLLREHPDLYAAHRVHGTELSRHSVGKDDPSHARKLQLRAARRARGRAAGMAAAVLFLSAAGSVYVFSQIRPPAFEDALADFRAAWQSGHDPSIGEFFLADAQRAELDRLRAARLARDWMASMPALGEPNPRQDETRGTADFEVATGSKLRTTWQVIDGDWRVSELKYPPPPIEPVAMDLEAAWNRSDFAGVASFYRPDRHENAEASLRRLAERREWRPQLPRSMRHRTHTLGETREEVFLALPEGELRFLMDYLEDSWEVSSLKPPP